MSAVTARSVGRALCIGVDTSGLVAGAEADARSLAAVAGRLGFLTPVLLLGAAATRDAVLSRIHEAAAVSEPGDLFVLTFSGHGGRKKGSDRHGLVGVRGVWMLYDRSLFDAEMHEALAEFRPNVRVLVVSDSCNGGVPEAERDEQPSAVAASVLVMTACGRDQFADARELPGHFTNALLGAWNNGGLNGGYRRFHEAIAARMPAYQTPDYYWVGRPDPTFEAQRPFTV